MPTSLISATHLAPGHLTPQASAGDYSVMLLRRISDGGEVGTHALEAETHLEDLAFVPSNQFSLIGVFALNGDGLLEIVAEGACYEGGAASDYAVEQDEVVTIDALGFQCGV